ncbi:RIP metalloprotease RseP [Sandarakinorhabdus limnophila]|uniref:RIP metalloprotease RseP n=1 Tax=Sandarakinorhabdus limnophila TaxID=210512 RepID=UPI0003B3DF34|nr:RIP metalloprotease RseP [Sandarakinorhabdus limnophila]
MSELAFLPQPGLIFTLASFIAMIAVLVVVHEGGHYLAGRLFGAKIEAFGVGFGRELLGWTDRRGVRWKINAIPLGGYVKFVGDMNEASQVDPAILSLPEKDRRGLFAFLPLWQRAVIVAAGPAINFLFAILILAGFNLALGHQASPPVVERVMPGSAAERAGVAVGDRILSVDGKAVERFEDITAEIVTGTGNRVELLVQRGTAQRRIVVTPNMVETKDRFGNVSRHPRLGILRPAEVVQQVGVPDALRLAVIDTWSITQTIGRTLRQVVVGERAITEMGGPVKTAQIAGQQASLGLLSAVAFMAFFSINLGFINLLPIPMLDGGHLLLYGIEAVRRQPMAEKVQQWAFMSGFAALMSLMAVLTWHDMISVGLLNRLANLLG